MKAPSKPFKIFLVFLAFLVLLVLTGYGILRYYSSPSAFLKHALHISTIPESVSDLRMGNDIWTDEVDCFYFTIKPEDFQKLLAGRQFEKVELDFPLETHTMHIRSPATVSGHSSFRWETNGADCMIYPDDSHTHVIVVFSAD